MVTRPSVSEFRRQASIYKEEKWLGKKNKLDGKTYSKLTKVAKPLSEQHVIVSNKMKSSHVDPQAVDLTVEKQPP